MNKFFNISGPCNPEKHYMLSPSARCGDLFQLIDQELYFAIHAARQTGKTTLLIALTKQLEAMGKYHALYVSLESCQGLDDPEKGLPAVARSISSAWNIRRDLREIYPFKYGAYEGDFTNMVKLSIAECAEHLDKPLVVLFDEVDCLANGTLVTFLRQIRDGYVNRAFAPFAHSLALVGMRDVRDYKAHVRTDRETLGSASPFNIKTKSLTLRSFTQPEVAALYAQHTEATGQAFPDEVVQWLFEQTQGQPWLVNAVAREMIMDIGGNDPAVELTQSMARQAVQNIILRRETHIDSLLERLKERRVQRVIEPMMVGEADEYDPLSDDLQYVMDLGLVKSERGRVSPANPIYAEVIGRTLSYRSQYRMDTERLPFTLQRFGTPDGGLDMSAMLEAFQQFWRENSDIWTEKYDYKEAAPHLVMMAFLQRVLNGGGHLVREFATGRKRMDLIVELNGFRYPVEIKLRYSDKTMDEGIGQLSGYLDTLGLSEGWLVIFDRRPDVIWDNKVARRDVETENGKLLHVYLM
jgi:hypothetical protein